MYHNHYKDNEKARCERISTENNNMIGRIKNYQDELLLRDKDIERLRETRKKLEDDVDRAKANTKVCVMCYILVESV